MTLQNTGNREPTVSEDLSIPLSERKASPYPTSGSVRRENPYNSILKSQVSEEDVSDSDSDEEDVPEFEQSLSDPEGQRLLYFSATVNSVVTPEFMPDTVRSMTARDRLIFNKLLEHLVHSDPEFRKCFPSKF